MSIATLIPFTTSAALARVPGLRHGFFGREGGVSEGAYGGLNTSETGGDAPEPVARNRALAAAELGFGPEALMTLAQVHSGRVVTLEAPLAAGERPEADAMVTARPGVLLGILAADCAPVLLADPEARVIGAAHAGWKGAASGIIGNTVEAMVALGAEPARIVAAIGPAISAEHYEVGDTFRDEFLRLQPGSGRFFSTPSGGKPHFDLPAFVLHQIQACGVGHAEPSPASTYAHPDRYFSFRLATHRGTLTGRQISAIGWLEEQA